MRRALALTTIIAACASSALAQQDRYGPPRSFEPMRAAPAPLPAGAVLGWNGKTAAPAPDAPAEPVAAQAMTPAAYRFQPAVQAAPAPPPAQVYQPAPYRQPYPASPVAPSQPPAAPAPVAAPAPPPVTQSPQIAPAPAPARTAANSNSGPRFYSVARQYGAAPDPIPVSQPRRGEALTLAEPPATPGLGRSFAPLDDGRANQAVAVPDTKHNAASNRVSRLGL